MSDKDIVTILDSMYEENAVANGWCRKAYLYNKQINDTLNELKSEVLNKPVEEWPKININWTLEADDFCYALDNTSPVLFAKEYPNIIVGWVACNEFHTKLHHYNKRAEHELWELGSPYKLARVIAYTSKGHPITPVLVKPHPTSEGEVFLVGGNHRYAMVITLGLLNMPILATLEHKTSLSKLMNIQWDK